MNQKTPLLLPLEGLADSLGESPEAKRKSRRQGATRELHQRRDEIRIGSRFTRWTVTGHDDKSRVGDRRLWCKCDCGTIRSCRIDNLRNKQTKSCGCLRDELGRARMITHGMSSNGKQSKVYSTHAHMLQRCTNPKDAKYPRYGGRGIKICDRWLNGERGKIGVECFAEDMGEPPSRSHSIDRKDNDGNYEKSNCQWGTPLQQATNSSKNIFIEHAGKRQTLSQWAREIGMKAECISRRMKRGWSVERALTKTPREKYWSKP